MGFQSLLSEAAGWERELCMFDMGKCCWKTCEHSGMQERRDGTSFLDIVLAIELKFPLFLLIAA